MAKLIIVITRKVNVVGNLPQRRKDNKKINVLHGLSIGLFYMCSCRGSNFSIYKYKNNGYEYIRIYLIV